MNRKAGAKEKTRKVGCGLKCKVKQFGLWNR